MLSEGDIVAERYKVLEEVGSGRTSVVYRSQDTQTGNIIALKAIRREYLTSNPDGTMRFMREGAVLKQLDHPHVIQVYDTIDKVDDSYIVMQYLPGGSLEYRLMLNGPLPITQALSIGHKVASGLAYLHELKIIHRDLTPSNIMFDDDGEPYIMDLSVAHMGHMSPLTMKSALLGSLIYMSPEVVLGNQAGPKSDMWAFGMTLYKMLTGQLPIQIDSLKDVNMLTRTPVAGVRTLRPDAPVGVEALLQQLLAIQPEQRPASMQQVAAELQTLS
jgi:eukaryotic-like serine/threonine-protein kinase